MNGAQSSKADRAEQGVGGGGGKLRDQQKALTRQRIIRAARGCFLSDGVADTSFDEIARRAGISRATVYLHYPRKEALLLGMLQEDWEAQAQLFAAIPAGTHAPEDFALWLRQLIAAYRGRRESMGLYTIVLGQDPAIADLIEAQRRVLLGLLGKRFSVFHIDDQTSAEQRVAAYLMLVQIEQFCLMSVRPVWEDAIDAGTDLLACRIAAFVESGK